MTSSESAAEMLFEFIYEIHKRRNLNDRTAFFIMLARYYRLATKFLGDVLQVRANGKTVVTHFDQATQTLSAVMPATTESRFWTPAGVTDKLRDGCHLNDTFAQHCQIRFGATIAEVDFKIAGQEIFDGMVRILMDGQDETPISELPKFLQVDLNPEETTAGQRRRGAWVERIGRAARDFLTHDLTCKAVMVARAGIHPEDVHKEIVNTPEKVAIRLRWDSPTDPGHKLEFDSDSDGLAARLAAEWADRKAADGVHDWQRTVEAFQDIWQCEPTAEEFRHIACNLLREVIKDANLT